MTHCSIAVWVLSALSSSSSLSSEALCMYKSRFHCCLATSYRNELFPYGSQWSICFDYVILSHPYSYSPINILFPFHFPPRNEIQSITNTMRMDCVHLSLWACPAVSHTACQDCSSTTLSISLCLSFCTGLFSSAHETEPSEQWELRDSDWAKRQLMRRTRGHSWDREGGEEGGGVVGAPSPELQPRPPVSREVSQGQIRHELKGQTVT